jgi:hypothetical protein
VNRWKLNQRLAAVLGLIGGALGVIVGMIQAIFGARAPNWTGNKADPTALGLLTILLSAVSVLSALILLHRQPISTLLRLAAALGLLVPGSLCFSTGGAMWYLPGAILFTGGVCAVIAGDAERTRQVTSAAWVPLLISILGGFEIFMAVSAGPAATIVVGIIGGLALMAAPWIKGRAAPIMLLLIGTLPFAVIAWWSVAAPVLAVVALGIGLAWLRSGHSRKHIRAKSISATDDVTASVSPVPYA